MSEPFGPARGYKFLIVSGPGELFRPEDVVGVPADEFGPGYLPVFKATDLIPVWVHFLADRNSSFETATVAGRDALKVMQAYGADHVAIDPRPDNPGRLVPIADFIAGVAD